MNNISHKLYLGFITYGDQTAKYLSDFLSSVNNQSYKDFNILVFDNSETEDNDNVKFIKANYPEIEFMHGEGNVGFARGYNQMIARAIQGGAEYFLALNPDMVLAPEMISEAMIAIQKDEKIGAVAPKILKWDFVNHQKTNIIDSQGLYITKEHRFSDIDQGKIDLAQDNMITKEVFGFTGAAVLFRINALADVAFSNGKYQEYFDELMFMYKEDCDLSYRLRLAGWKIIFSPLAVAYHDRTASPKGESIWQIIMNRQNKSRLVKKWSFLNHWILLVKFMKLSFSWRVRLATSWYQIKSLIFVILFEQYLLKKLITLWKLLPEIKKRRQQLKIRIRVMEIEKLME